MGTRAILAAVLDDGSIIASNLAQDGGEPMSWVLAKAFPTRAGALGLVVLGDLMSVHSDGSVTPSACGSKHRTYASLEALDAGKLANANHVHLFRDGGWEHMLDDEGQFQEWLASEMDTREPELVG